MFKPDDPAAITFNARCFQKNVHSVITCVSVFESLGLYCPLVENGGPKEETTRLVLPVQEQP